MKKFVFAVIITILSITCFSADLITQQVVVKTGENNKFKEYNEYSEISEKFAIIPGLKEGFVPQGLAYMENEDRFVISAYKDGNHSILSFIDAENGKMVKSLIICNEDGSYYTGHAGGVAVSDSNIWVSSGSKIRKIPLISVDEAKDEEKVFITEEFDAYTNASFTAYDKGVLWVGEFYHSNDYPTDKNHYFKTENGYANHSWMAGFKLGGVPEERPSAIPDYIISIPDIVQGVAFSQDAGIVLSTSYGRGNDSKLLIFGYVLDEIPETSVEINGKSVPMWVLHHEKLSAEIVGYPMSEGIILEKGFLFTLYESAAKKYLMTTKHATEYIWKTNLNSVDGK